MVQAGLGGARAHQAQLHISLQQAPAGLERRPAPAVDLQSPAVQMIDPGEDLPHDVLRGTLLGWPPCTPAALCGAALCLGPPGLRPAGPTPRRPWWTAAAAAPHPARWCSCTCVAAWAGEAWAARLGLSPAGPGPDGGGLQAVYVRDVQQEGHLRERSSAGCLCRVQAWMLCAPGIGVARPAPWDLWA